MKLNYLGYYLYNNETGEKTLCDIRPFLKAFCRVSSSEYKNTFHHHGDNVYLMYNTNNVFVFIITKDNDLIRKVNSSDLTESEIMDLLDENEHIGFASYVVLGDANLGFGMTLLSPRVDVFAGFINQILMSLGVYTWTFRLQAFVESATKADAMQMNFYSKATIELETQNTLCSDLLTLLTGQVVDTAQVEGLEIIIKPKARRDISNVVKRTLENIPDDGVKKLVLRAKEDVGSMLTDIYIVGSGGLSESVTVNNSVEFPIAIQRKFTANAKLTEKTNEFKAHEDFRQSTPDFINGFSNDDTWSTFVLGLSGNTQQS